MANVCMDTVVFFAAENDQKKGFLRLRQAVAECYPAGTAAHDTRLCRIFEQIPFSPPMYSPPFCHVVCTQTHRIRRQDMLLPPGSMINTGFQIHVWKHIHRPRYPVIPEQSPPQCRRAL